ncbi:DUF4870 domain-containing protein [Lutibacter sp.]
MENRTITEGKTMAIISYITWIGTLIAFIMNNDKRNSFASFHIRQAIGLSLFFISNSFLVVIINQWISVLFNLLLLALWIIGLVAATKGEEKKIPLFGDLFQDWFKNIA